MLFNDIFLFIFFIKIISISYNTALKAIIYLQIKKIVLTYFYVRFFVFLNLPKIVSFEQYKNHYT